MSDTMASISAYLSTVQSTIDSLPDAFATAGDDGDFSSVFATINSLFGGGTTATTATGPTTTSPTTGSDLTGSDVTSVASAYLGTPYVWGGTTPAGFDCSGFTQYVYAQEGITLPRTADEQSTVGIAVPSLADAQPGDLVFYAGSDGTASAPGHVGIYLGNGQMINAPETGSDVEVDPVGDPVAIRRIIGSPLDPSASAAATATLTGASPTADAQATSPVPATLAPMFLAAAAQYKVPVQLLTAVARTESNFNPTAVSSAGAEGLMQLMPSTAAGLGVDPLDPQQAIDGAAKLLSSYLAQYGSTPLALAAYNAGPGAVAQYGGVPPYAETQAYVTNVMSQLTTSTPTSTTPEEVA